MAKDKRNFKRPLHEACSKIETQPSMNYLIFEDGNIVATDAHVILIQSLYGHGFTESEIDQLEGKAIHREVFKDILRYDHIEVVDGSIVAKKGKIKVNIKLETLQEQEGDAYVNYKSLIDSASNTCNVEVPIIGFDLNLLARIAKLTLNDLGQVEFNFKGQGKACIVSGIGCDEQFLVMPCSLNPL